MNHRFAKSLKLPFKLPSKIFYHPVTDAIAPLYSKIITSPMAFATMEKKVATSEYKCFAAFEYDVNLILRNCMHYNGNSTIFYKIAKDMETKAQPMLRDARKLAKKYNTVTGKLLLIKKPLSFVRATSPCWR
jgi:hypothetical protein